MNVHFEVKKREYLISLFFNSCISPINIHFFHFLDILALFNICFNFVFLLLHSELKGY